MNPLARLLRENLLWDREWRAAQRRWWNQPWAIPCFILLMIIPGALRGNPKGMQVRLDIFPLWEPEIPLAEVLLWMWIIWHLAVAMTRDRATRTTSTLAMTLIDRRHVAVAKTFAPIYTALLVLMGLLLIRALMMTAEFTVSGRDTEEEILAWLGLEVWTNDILGARLLHLRGWVSDLLIWMNYLCRALIFPLCAVTITSWVAARHRVAWRAAAMSVIFIAVGLAALLAIYPLVLILLLPACVIIVAVGIAVWRRAKPRVIVLTALVTITGLATLHSIQPLILQPFLRENDLPDYWGRLRTIRSWPTWYIWPAVFADLTAHLLLPILWLVWWWRWTRRGFDEVYFYEE